MPKTPAWLLLALAAVLAAGGYWQVIAAPVFWCGRTEAFPATLVLTFLSLAQTALYFAAVAAPRWQKPYRLSQYAVLPFLFAGLWQIFAPHPRTLLFFGVLATIPLAIGLLLPRARWMRPHLPTLSALFVLSTLGFLAALGQIPFTLPGVTVPTGLVALSALAAAAASLAVIATLREALPLAAACHLPYALLLFPILRGKAPDLAYDSFMYKTTLPYQLAEWRTGDTALIDGYMVGTNLQEMLNALLVVLTRDYLPPFISTISFVLLAFIIPLAFPLARLPSPSGRLALAFAGLSAFVLTEAGIAQGTAYQEPLLLLFLVAALIRCPAWPAFIAIAIAIKINAAFIAPLIVLHHATSYQAFWRSPRCLLIATLAAAIVLAPQINRNVLFSGRVLGLNETLASVTDPPGPHQIMTRGATRYDAKVRGGVLNNELADDGGESGRVGESAVHEDDRRGGVGVGHGVPSRGCCAGRAVGEVLVTCGRT